MTTYHDGMELGDWRQGAQEAARFDIGLSKVSLQDSPLPSTWDIAKQNFVDSHRTQNIAAAAQNLNTTFDEVNDKIKAATGVSDLFNPMISEASPFMPVKMPDGKLPARPDGDLFEAWKARVRELRTTHPDALNWDEIETEPERRAYQIMKETRERTNTMSQRLGLIEPGQIPYIGNIPLVGATAALGANMMTSPIATAAQFAGGMAGTITSPVDTAINLFAGAAGNQAKSIVANAMKNAYINALAQAPLSAAKQYDYEKAGLPTGWRVWLSEVEGAAAAGFLLDAGIRTPVRAARRAMGAQDIGGVFLDAVPRANLAERPEGMAPIDPKVFEAAATGDLKATREILEKSGALEDPAIRGALDHMETGAKMDAVMIERLKEMGVAQSEGFRILSNLLEGGYARAPDRLAADVDAMRNPSQPAIASPDLDRVVSVSRAALEQIRADLPQIVEMAVEARIPEVEAIVRTAVKDLGQKGSAPDQIAAQVAKDLQEVMADPRVADAVRLTSGGLSPPEMAAIVRRSPDLKRYLDPEIDRPRQALAIASLDDVGFGRVMAGEIAAPLAAHVADTVTPQHHAKVFDDIARERPQSLDELRQLLADLPPREAGAEPVMKSGASGIDDPAGPKAKAQLEAMKVDQAAAIEEATAALKERDKIASKVEGLQGEVAKLVDKPDLSEADAMKLAKARAELAELEPQLERLKADTSPDQAGAQAMYRIAMMAYHQRREADVFRAVNHALELARKITPSDTKIEVKPELRQDGIVLDAASDIDTGNIALAIRAVDPDARMGHEALHTLVTKGLISPAEVAELAALARENGTFANEAKYREAYADRPNLERQIEEEAAASYVEAVVRGDIKQAENTIANRVKDFIERIKNLLKGYGFKTRDDIVTALLNGDMARREPVRQWMRENDISALAVRPDAGVMFAMADRETGQSMRRDMDALGFFSKLDEVLSSFGPKDRVTAQTLQSKGVKAGEIEARGLAGLLKDGAAAVGDLQAAAKASPVELREVMRSPPDMEALNNVASMYHGMPFDELSSQQQRMIRSELGVDDGSASAPKWSSYSLDPSNPTYRETVLHLPGEEAADKAVPPPSPFRSGHFPEPNIIGHMMTSMVRHDGKPVFLIDQIQSDWGQKIRDEGIAATPDALARQDELRARAASARSEYDALRQTVDTTMRLINDANRANGWSDKTIRQTAEAIGVDWPAFDAARTRMFDELQPEVNRLEAEVRQITEKAGVPGHPLVNTTDQWTVTTLRRALRQAAEADASYIAIPSGDTVLSYNPGDMNGMVQFYGRTQGRQSFDIGPDLEPVAKGESRAPIEGIVPKNLRKLIEKLDKDAPKPIRVDQVETPSKGMAGLGFTLFPLTDKIKQEVTQRGQVMFAFAGPKATTARRDMLKLAERMESKGRKPEHIFKQTGWFRGHDKLWRFEIDDSNALLQDLDAISKPWTNRPKDAPTGKDLRIIDAAPLKDVLDHPALFAAYPFLEKMPVRVIYGDSLPAELNQTGKFSLREIGNRRSMSVTVRGRSVIEVHRALLHELQHYIQTKEGWDAGASPKNFTPGGIDARRPNRGTDLFPLTVGDRMVLWHEEKLQELQRDHAQGRMKSLTENDSLRSLNKSAAEQMRMGERGYSKSPGEAEANLTMERGALTAEERRDAFPMAQWPRDLDPAAPVQFSKWRPAIEAAQDALARTKGYRKRYFAPQMVGDRTRMSRLEQANLVEDRINFDWLGSDGTPAVRVEVREYPFSGTAEYMGERILRDYSSNSSDEAVSIMALQPAERAAFVDDIERGLRERNLRMVVNTERMDADEAAWWWSRNEANGDQDPRRFISDVEDALYEKHGNGVVLKPGNGYGEDWSFSVTGMLGRKKKFKTEEFGVVEDVWLDGDELWGMINAARKRRGEISRDDVANEYRGIDRAIIDDMRRDDKGGLVMFAFAGERAKTADLEALARAKKMTADGVDRTKIWQDTGWFLGVDGKWKWEIDDSDSYFMPPSGTGRDRYFVGELLAHDKFDGAYPYVQDRTVTMTPGDNAAHVQHYDGLTSFRLGLDSKDPRASMLHEMQHEAQTKEGFARGGSPGEFYKRYFSIGPITVSNAGQARRQYLRQAGEVEARAVEKRMDMTPEERRARPPWLDYDVPEDQQIVRFADGSGPMFAFAESTPQSRAKVSEEIKRIINDRTQRQPGERLGTGEQDSGPGARQARFGRALDGQPDPSLGRGQSAQGPSAEGATGAGESRLPVTEILRNAVWDHIGDRLTPEQARSRKEAQGFTINAWHATFKTFDTPDPFRPLRDFGFHVAVGKPDAANERLGFAVTFHAKLDAFVAKVLGVAEKSWYAKRENKGDEARIMALAVKSHNPLRLPDLIQWEMPGQWKEGLNPDNSPAWLRDWVRNWFIDNNAYSITQQQLLAQSHTFSRDVAAELERRGYDGIVYTNKAEAKGQDSLLVWNPAQVRSAFDAFDERAVNDVGLRASDKYIEQDIRDIANRVMQEEGIAQQNLMFAMADNAQPEQPKRPIEQDYAVIDRLQKINELIEACR